MHNTSAFAQIIYKRPHSSSLVRNNIQYNMSFGGLKIAITISVRVYFALLKCLSVVLIIKLKKQITTFFRRL